MAQIYFHYSTSETVVVDPRANTAEDFFDLHDQATRNVRALITAPCPEDWRDWVLHVSDGNGDELFTMPFSSLLGRPN
jgi:hypothetical protein